MTSPLPSRVHGAASRFRLPPSTFVALLVGVVAIALSGMLAVRAHEQHADAVDAATAAFEQARELDEVLLSLADVEAAALRLDGAGADTARPSLAVETEAVALALQVPLPVGASTSRMRLRAAIEQRLADLRRGNPVDGSRAAMSTLIDDVRGEQAAAIRATTAAVTTARSTARATLVGGTAVLFALFSMAIVLVLRELLQRHRELWLRAGEAGVARAMLGDKRSGEVAGPVISFLADYLGAVVGAFFTGSSATGFSLRGSYALAASDDDRVLKQGEGLTGQAIAARQALQVSGLSADYLAVTSSTGRAMAPTSVIAVPTIVDDEVNGVVELAFVTPLHGGELELLERISGALGVGVRSAVYRRQIEDHLEETQRQAEEMQAQQEELRVNNEELEEQGRALRDAHARLEEQQNSLEENNEKLQAQTTVMAQQQLELVRIADEVVAKNSELERSSQYKSNFLANMSHELRTPLNSTLILAKLLSENSEGNLTQEQVKFAETIHAAGNDLLELINDVLDLAKIEAGHVDVKLMPVTVSALTASMRRLFEPVALTRGLDFKIVLKTDVPATIETDALRLEQVLKNLLSNAFKFTEHGGVTLVISVSGGDVRFAVTDTGIGIADDQQALVFEAFRQVDDGSARKHGGTGLGLSISRDLAVLLGGRLSLKSEIGHGSTFTLTVPALAQTQTQTQTQTPTTTTKPVAPAPAPKPALPKTTTAPTMSPASAASARSILIVEDDAAFAAVLADVARSAGFQPLLAETADAAVELAVHHVPHAVLLDVRLPDHSGLAVLDRLKRTARTRHIPVHMISGVSDHARTAMVMGAVGYTMKPVQVEDLRLVLARLTDRADAKLKRVLVIEADPAQRESVRALLSHEGVEVSCAGSAHEARRHLLEHTYDCVVMDLSFPDESGQQLLQTMSQTADHAFPPVIVYTARTLSKNDEDALRQYSSSIIVKGARSPERLLDEVTLFLHQVESELPPERQRMLRHSRDREQLFEGRTLLIVEDDVRNIFALSRVLEPRGAKIEIARNGIEALAQLEAHPEVELVLMDVMMPEMDGLEAMRRIRQQSKWASLPIISLTAKAMRDDQEKCLAAGANDYVAKPIDVDKLLSLIRVWMPKR